MPRTTDRVTADVLATLVALAVDDVRTHGDATAVVRVRATDVDVELGWQGLAGDHPVEALCGWTAPPDWSAVGVVATGRMRHLDRPAAAPVPVWTAHLVGRSGAWASWWQPAAGGRRAEPVALSGPAASPSRPEGRVDDACRRALQLPTAAPEVGTAVLWELQWLDGIVEAAASGGPVSWPAVANLHPAVGAFGVGGGPGDSPLSPEAVAAAARRLAAVRGWSDLRSACAAGRWAAPEVDGRVAAWLDDGAFSRWVLGAYPDAADLRSAVGEILSGPVAAAVDAVLHGEPP